MTSPSLVSRKTDPDVLAKLLREVVDLHEVDFNKSFDELGGDSLDWLEFCFRVEETFHMDLPNSDPLYKAGRTMSLHALLDALRQRGK